MINIKHYYTDKKYKELLTHMVVLCDTKEKNSTHILEYFDKVGIRYEHRSLKTGDYSFKIETCAELGFQQDTYFVDELCIERKNSVSEISGNFVEKDDRFFKEISRMVFINECYIIIEDDSFNDIIEHNYKSKYNETAFLRTLIATQRKANFNLYFVKKEHMGRIIYELCLSVLNSKILK